ncbi:ABC transporter permease [Caldisericum exile]|uniref:ABC transporter permease protein n=1 Tax=Caldisericum exile (strain DSM 21853 / NBRC 104410 / AZM16c01) TaxID=511051 RepID=A0A7U6JG07_CALEA|nr:ABC transporter permease subunit [Caldisericum exile]BAL81064.1 putative ABC transporter permease protein [Caldisericum exile AZM16c01]
MKEKRILTQIISQLLIIILLIGVVYAFYKKQINIASYVEDLRVSSLPYYIFRSLIRMFTAYVISLLFAFTYGYLAATSERREALMIPILDILQSVPILGFFPVAIAFFISLFPNSILGVELASIFLIFTSQSWNIAFGVYESIKAIPKDIKEAYEFFDPVCNLKLRRLYIPASVPKIIYNSIVSWSNGWYFLVASEIFAVGEKSFRLPGIGSFILVSATENKIGLVLLGILSLGVTIFFLDMFMWRPLLQWSRKFRYSISPGEEEEREVLDIVIIFWEFVGSIINAIKKPFDKIEFERLNLKNVFRFKVFEIVERIIKYGLLAASVIAVIYIVFYTVKGIYSIALSFKLSYILIVLRSLLFSTLRVLSSYVFAVLWTVPFAIFLYNRKKIANFILPVFQILSSIPAISFFPLLLYFLLPFKFGLELSSIILILTGMQWYIFFLVLGGLKAIPNDLLEVVDSYGVKGNLRLRRLLIPSILPSFLTGTITAMGGAWNALVVAEYIDIKGQPFSVEGIGALLNTSLAQNEKALFTLALVSLVFMVYSINHFVYRPLYDKILDRYRMEA